MTMKKLAAIDSSLESLTFIKKIIHDIPFLNFYKQKLFTYLTYFSLDL